jgi:Deacetylase PdaC/Protein of unknown function (DUF3298)
MKSIAFIFSCTLLLISCKSDTPTYAPSTNNNASNGAESMSIQSSKMTKIEGDCDKVCAKMSLSFPEIKGGNSDFQMAVQEWVMSWVRDNTLSDENKKRMTLAETSAAFTSAYQKELKENPSNFHGYEVENTDTILCNTEKVVSLRMDLYVNMGGAHPNYQTTIANFDPKTGGPIFVNKVIKDQKAILNLLTPRYIALKSAQSGEKFKIQTDNGQLTFPTNWAYTEKGILFHYNAYEVGSYSIGDADLFLTWEEMGAAAGKL